MDTEISWSAKVGKNIFLSRLKKPKAVLAFAVGLIIAIPLVAELVSELENDFNLNPETSYLIVVVVLVVLTIFIYKTNREILGKDSILNYTVNDKGIIVNDKSYLWTEYQYFQDQYLFRKNVSPAILENINLDAFIISLLKKRMSDKGKLVLIMENQDTYEKVSQIVTSKLTDALN